MKFKMYHQNFNVLDLNKSIDFYNKALGLVEIKPRKISKDNSFEIAYLGNDTTDFYLELTCLKDRTEKYDLGDEEFHLAFQVDNYEEAYKLHSKMNCICYENKNMGIYFINDLDGYWLEIVPAKR